MKKEELIEKVKHANIKKIIKLSALGFGFALIIFVSFFDAFLDLEHFDWSKWAANTSILVGIMIFGILMGTSIGTDNQREKIGGLYQVNCATYVETSKLIEDIKIFFSQFWLWYKEKKLIEKKVSYLIDNQFDTRVAKLIVQNIEREDLVLGKFIYDETKPIEKIYVKNDIKFKKIPLEQRDIIYKLFVIKLDTYNESYYLSLYDDSEADINEAEKGKYISQKISRDKRRNFIMKLLSSLAISIVWSAITVQELTGEDGSKKAWLNLLSRITALTTSFASGYATAVVNVRDQAKAIDNKSSILKEYKSYYDKKLFIPESYEETMEREYREQEEALKKQEHEKELEEQLETIDIVEVLEDIE